MLKCAVRKAVLLLMPILITACNITFAASGSNDNPPADNPLQYRTYLPNQLPLDEEGWTIITPSSDTRIVYVSNSEGDDSNDGLSPNSPKQSIEAADELIRDGYPDHMLLKRGDVWENFQGFGRYKSGRNAAEPLVIGYYGEHGERPVIKTAAHFLHPNGYAADYLAFIGLEIYNSRNDPDSDDFTDDSSSSIRLVGGGRDLLFEDCKIRFMQLTTTTYIWDGHEENIVSNFKLRRCIIVDNWARGTTDAHDNRPQGYYAADTHGILIEECVFDHNGWNESFEDSNANMYNHNIYMSTTNYPPIIVKGNILSRGSAHGLQLRSGGIAEDNLFVRNAVGMNAGYSSYPVYNTENTYVRKNVIMSGRPQIPDDWSGQQSGAIWGIWKQLINNFHCNDNIVSNIYDDRGSNIDPYPGQEPNEYGYGNIAWNWGTADFPEINPGYKDPERTVASYNRSLGHPESFDDFMETVRNRPVHTWPYEYSAAAVNDYIRDGFSVTNNHKPVAEFSHSEPGTLPATVSFTSYSTDPDGEELDHTWIFEDIIYDEYGTGSIIDKGTSSETNPTYTYTYPGVYTVILTVTDSKGASESSSTQIIVDGNNPPVPVFEADVTRGDAPLTVTFNMSGSYDLDGDAMTFALDYGDGSTDTTKGTSLSHVFQPGEFTVGLTVSDGVNSSFERTITVDVNDPTIETIDYPAAADAFLNAEDPDTNFGDAVNSRISQTSYHGIMRFDFSENTQPLVSAHLYMPVKFGQNGCAVKYVSDDSWAESGVTWNNQPSSGGPPAECRFEGSYAVFDISDQVLTESDRVISLLLYGLTDNWQEFRYKETSYAFPYLRIVSRVGE